MEKIVSEKELAQLAEELSAQLKREKPKEKARIIALVGDLGAGKTTFTKHFLRALGVEEDVISPTFLIIKSYPLKGLFYTQAIHIDTYRLEDPQELLKLGFQEVINNPKNIVLIEWAERIKELLPESAIWIELSHKEDEKRSFSIRRG